MTELAARPEDIEATSRRLAEATADIGTVLDHLDGRSRVLSASWSGAAQEAYAFAHRRWQADYAELVQFLADSSQAAHVASQRYEEAERENASRWRIG